MVDGPFESFARNGEDVVLWRALKHIDRGRYVDIGTESPSEDSATRAFYDAGWRGVVVPATDGSVDRFAAQRPEDRVAALPVDAVFDETGGPAGEIHLAVVDCAAGGIEVSGRAGAPEPDVAGAGGSLGIDLHRWRPWVVLLRDSRSGRDSAAGRSPADHEPALLDAGYELCLRDGVSRFYVSGERRGELATVLFYGPNVHDDYSTPNERALTNELARAQAELTAARAELAEAARDVIEWRAAALRRWSESFATNAPMTSQDVAHLRGELDAIRATVSWRVTRPLRAVRGVVGSVRPGR